MGLVSKKSVRVLGVVLAVLLLAVVAVKVFLPAEKIRDLALDQARAKLGREVSVGEVAVSLKGGLGVRLGDFAIHNPEGFAGEHLLITRALDLKLAIKPLLRGEVRVDRLVIDSPEANLVRRADGSDNFTFLPTKTGEAAAGDGSAESAATAPPLSIASLTLQDGVISFTDEAAGKNELQALQMTGLVLGLSLTDPTPGSYQAIGRLGADQIKMTGPSEIPELDGTVDFDLTWDTSASRLSITRADMKVMDLPLTATGQVVTSGETPAARIQIKGADLPLVDLAKLTPPEVARNISGDRSSGLLDATVDLDLPGVAGSQMLTSGQVTVRDADLALAQPFLPPEQTGILTGRGDLEMKFDHTGGASDQLTYSGKFTAKGVSFIENSLVDELQNLNAVLDITPDQITIESCEARFTSGSFNLRGTLRDPFPYFLPPQMQEGVPAKTPHLSFAMRSPRLDVDQLLPAASPTGSPASRPVPGPSSVMVDRQFPDLTCDGTFRADTLIYMQVPFTEVRGLAKLRDRVLSFDEVEGQVYQGQVTGQVDVDLNELNDPVFTGNYQATNIQVNDFVTRFAGLSGIVFGQCNLTGTFGAQGLDPDIIRNSLTMNADAGIEEGRAFLDGKVYRVLNLLAERGGHSLPKDQALRDLATHIVVENGRVGLDSLTTRLGQIGDLAVSGFYAFTGDLDYSGTLLLTEVETDKVFNNGVLGEVARLLGDERPQRLEVPLTIGGTRDDPKIKLEWGMVTNDLQQRAVKKFESKQKNEALDKLNDLFKRLK